MSPITEEEALIAEEVITTSVRMDELDFIYKDAHVYLDRKYALYLKYILPSDLEIDRIIKEKLSENVLPALEYDQV